MNTTGQHVDAPTEASFPLDAALELRQRLRGPLVLRGDDGYGAARRIFVATPEHLPKLIAYCDVFRDVSLCIDFARRYSLDLTVRSGGHSPAGYSVNSGMVLDVSRINHVVIDPATQRAIIGTGATFGRINASLDLYRLHLPGGSCSEVAAGGFLLGGGYGYTSLIFGMNCDNLLEALVALPDGTIVTASESVNPDLFWALRGGGGNCFGVLLQMIYRLHSLWRVCGFALSWALDDAAAALVELQHRFTGPGVPAGLGYQGAFESDGETRRLVIRGVFAGTRKQARDVLAPLLATRGAVVDFEAVSTFLDLDGSLLNARDARFESGLHALADSRFIERQLDMAAWQEIIECLRELPNERVAIGFEPYGGQIRQIPVGATAFIHRTASFNVYAWVFWAGEAEGRACVDCMDRLMAVLGRFSENRANQNYPRRGNPVYREMYWGDSLPALLAIKHKYDPENLLTFGQTASLPTGGLEPQFADPPQPSGISDAIERPRFLWRPSRWSGWHW